MGLAVGLAAVPAALGLVAASAAPVGTVVPDSFKAWKPSGSALLLAEDFTGTDGTALDGTTTDHTGQTWTQTSGTWTIQGNAAASTAVQASSLHAATGTAHHAVEAEVTVTGGIDIGLFVNGNSTRAQGLVLAYTNSSGGQLSLWARRTGANAGDFLASSAGGLGNNGTYSLRLESGADNVVRGYFDGVLRVTYSYAAGDITMYKASTHEYVGLWSWGDANARFNDVHADRVMPS